MKCPSCPRILQWTDGAFCAECMKPAPSPQPEMPERVDGWWWDGAKYRRVDPHDEVMPLDTVRALAELAGLHIVTKEERQRMVNDKLDAAHTKAERAVLDAIDALGQDDEFWHSHKVAKFSFLTKLAEAVLARRRK